MSILKKVFPQSSRWERHRKLNILIGALAITVIILVAVLYVILRVSGYQLPPQP